MSWCTVARLHPPARKRGQSEEQDPFAARQEQQPAEDAGEQRAPPVGRGQRGHEQQRERVRLHAQVRNPTARGDRGADPHGGGNRNPERFAEAVEAPDQRQPTQRGQPDRDRRAGYTRHCRHQRRDDQGEQRRRRSENGVPVVEYEALTRGDVLGERQRDEGIVAEKPMVDTEGRDDRNEAACQEDVNGNPVAHRGLHGESWGGPTARSNSPRSRSLCAKRAA